MKKRSFYSILLLFIGILMATMGCRTQKMQTKYGIKTAKYISVDKSDVAVNADKQ